MGVLEKRSSQVEHRHKCALIILLKFEGVSRHIDVTCLKVPGRTTIEKPTLEALKSPFFMQAAGTGNQPAHEPDTVEKQP